MIFSGSERGFTLVEVLVAFAIVATTLGVLTSAMSKSATTMNSLNGRQSAVLLAQSKLAEMVPRDAGEPETVVGEIDGGIEWRVTFAPYGTRADKESWPLDAYTVTATVTYPDRGKMASFSLDTLKLSARR